MEISTSNIYYESKNTQKNVLEIVKDSKAQKHIEKSSHTQEQSETKTKPNNVQNFARLCEKFPDIAFVVIDSIGGILPEYNGICNTAAFGELDKVSMRIDEKVIEKLEDDFDYISMTIENVAFNYQDVKNNAVASGCRYASADIRYDGATLVRMQTLYVKYPPKLARETGFLEPSLREDTNQKYFQTFLLNIQYEVYNKLWEIGEEDAEKDHPKLEKKYAEEYQKHFLYEQEDILK